MNDLGLFFRPRLENADIDHMVETCLPSATSANLADMKRGSLFCWRPHLLEVEST
jgi:hypothetical protein